MGIRSGARAHDQERSADDDLSGPKNGLADEADLVCPHSNATRGDVDGSVTVVDD